MAIDSTYKIEIESPMGTQEVKLTFKAKGAALSGSSESSFGTSTFTGKGPCIKSRHSRENGNPC